jgi:hypothetical protein
VSLSAIDNQIHIFILGPVPSILLECELAVCFKFKVFGSIADKSYVANASNLNPRPGVLHLPASEPNGKKQVMSCIFHGVESKRLTVETQQKLRSSAALSVECNDALYLGEVIHSIQTADRSWRTEVNVEHILTGLAGLVKFRERLFDDPQNRFDPRTHCGVYS